MTIQEWLQQQAKITVQLPGGYVLRVPVAALLGLDVSDAWKQQAATDGSWNHTLSNIDRLQHIDGVQDVTYDN